MSEALPMQESGDYKGFTYRLKGDGRAEINQGGVSIMFLNAVNARIWIDQAAIDQETTLTSIVPDATTVGGPDVEVTLTGSGFRPDTQMLWNNVPDACTYVNDTTLTTLVKASLTTIPSTATVAVKNGYFTTPSLAFTFTDAGG